MATTASAEDLLVAYSDLPGAPRLSEEVASAGPFGEMTGGADTHFEDFTSGLRAYVKEQRASGVPMGGTWFGGSGANPTGVVVGLDWADDDLDLDGALGEVLDSDDSDDRDVSDVSDDSHPPAKSAGPPPAAGIMTAVVGAGDPPAKSAGPPPGGIMAAVVATREEDEWVFADPSL